MLFHPWIAKLQDPVEETENLKWLLPNEPGYPKSAYIHKILDKMKVG
jgi:hypothetical protein